MATEIGRVTQSLCNTPTEIEKMGSLVFLRYSKWRRVDQVEIIPDYNRVEGAYIRGRYFGLAVSDKTAFSPDDSILVTIDGECPVQGDVEKIKEVFERVKEAMNKGTCKAELTETHLIIRTNLPAAPT